MSATGERGRASPAPEAVIDRAEPDPGASRAQHLLPGTIVLALAIAVCWLSFTGEPARAFLFPRVISVAMLLLAVWNFLRCVLGLSRVGTGFSSGELRRIAPGVVLSGALVYVAATLFGFYVASFAVFLLIYASYDPAPHTDVLAWLKRVGVASGFMLVIYGLFALLLRVQTPRGLFF